MEADLGRDAGLTIKSYDVLILELEKAGSHIGLRVQCLAAVFERCGRTSCRKNTNVLLGHAPVCLSPKWEFPPPSQTQSCVLERSLAHGRDLAVLAVSSSTTLTFACPWDLLKSSRRLERKGLKKEAITPAVCDTAGNNGEFAGVVRRP